MTDHPHPREASEQVALAWERIGRWLRAHAPASAALLRPPVGEAAIASVEESIGWPLPPALRAWYQLSDGINDPDGAASRWPTAFLPGRQAWYRLDQLQDAYVMQTRDWEREPGRVPVSCVTGDIWHGLYVDARPKEPSYGAMGRWTIELEPELLAPGSAAGWPLETWLSAVADALEQGRCLVEPGGRRVEDMWPALTVCEGLTWVDPHDPRRIPEGRALLDGPR
ncbi:SMI1/KNR4 family protein [Streptomyces sp. BRB081]|uniref:SMI1/KNR4 family protein n=1 Tax=Streptomyces sp. BRB081 TaxID=2769544 RepID=UPI0018AC970F|nr:SMI1/KNR4 family protein [Streptomyces sp. BRB081]MBL3803085.1 SMI1/KNR4 family protein [Streptomyces sp. BRB081]